MPQTQAADNMHAMKYRGRNEDFRESMNRNAFGLKDSDAHYHEFREVLLEQRFLPGGRVQGAIGALRQTTAFNCFVSGTIMDSYVAKPGSIMHRAHEAAATMRLGGGIGYDFSTLRHRGSFVRQLQSTASGPVSFMKIYDAVGLATASSGHRRGAQMGVLRVDHPDIEEFILAKQNDNQLTGFNVSVAVTDEFMEAALGGKDFELKFNGEAVRTVQADYLFERMMRSTYDYAEPGVLFIDRVNQMNNLAYAETIAATNPCVPADTPILTDRGYVPIGSRCGHKTSVWNGFDWAEVVPRLTGHNQPLVRVVLSNGTDLICTPAHRFILRDGSRVEAGKLWAGAKLVKWQPPVVQGTLQISESLYEQGFFSGDGWTDERGRQYVGLYGAKKVLAKHFTDVVSSHEYADTDGFVKAQDGETRIFLYFGKERFHHKGFIPNATYDVASRLSWFAGLCDSDGCATRAEDEHGIGVQVSSKDRSFLLQTLLMLQTLGVSANLGAMKDCWRLCVSANGVQVLQGLGFRTMRLDLNGNNPQRDAARFVSVVAVEDTGEHEAVYCFTEEQHHAGVFNGVLTGQCGEQPLPPYGACLLGSFNLTKYLRAGPRVVVKDSQFQGSVAGYDFDYDQLKHDIPIVVRAMDNVTDRTLYPLAEQKAEAVSKRRMGLGVTGLANAAESLGNPYGSPGFLEFESKVLEIIRDECYRASVQLAKEKGSFPLFDPDRYLAQGFAKTLPDDIRDGIAKTGLRNSHLTSIAPTGTISMCADNVSSSIEPVFAYETKRPVNTPDGQVIMNIEDYGTKFLNTRGKLAADVTASEHLAVLTTAQKYVDSAVSKTVNMDGRTMPWADFKDLYKRAWEAGAKGCTTFNIAGLRSALLTAAEAPEGGACAVDAEGRRDCA
jgi:ribonucleoside-diphosphate reductase alpha chain